jgi:hypothetical protein
MKGKSSRKVSEFKSAMRGRAWPAWLAFCLALWSLGPALPAYAGQAKYISFEAPGAYFGTFPSSINPAGVVTGSYLDDNFVSHGFLRAPDGTFTEFDAPGAGAVGAFAEGTYPVAIDRAGIVTGNYVDDNDVSHGFLRAPDGKLTTFNAPGAGTAPNTGLPEGTYPVAINPAGTITGYRYGASGLCGFLRAPDGTFTEFEAPGASNGTFPAAINPAGVVTGYYQDESYVYHSFLRAPDGTFTKFEAPGARTGDDYGTFPVSINPAGVVTGSYDDENGLSHGFVRAADGTFTEFEAPHAVEGTFPVSINPAGAIAGSYDGANGLGHGFVRAADGTFTEFEADNQGTVAVAINPVGVIAGYRGNASNAGNYYGFLRIPPSQ